MLSRNLEDTLRRALALANARQHEYATLEHLLMALTDDEDAAAVLDGCAIELDRVRANLCDFLDHELTGLAVEGVADAKPTAGFQRVIQRAAIHIESSGRSEVTGANVLVALFSEPESHAVFFLREQNMSRLDAVNYVSRGIAKPPGVGERRCVPTFSGSLEAPLSSRAFEQTLRRAMTLARVRHHEYATLDHLLMALTDDADATAVLEACAVEVDLVRARLTASLDRQVASLTGEGAGDAKPTAALQRVVERAAIDAQNSSRTEVTGGNVLVALFSERESRIGPGGTDTLCKVWLLDDDHTPMEFVVHVLERFFGKSREDATRTMLQVDKDGAGICGVYPHEIAETKVAEAVGFARQHQHPLRCTIERD
jgi:ATP-dependent Clp protease ATP-binding subunit ClpA/ATP-dependent Clp protease adapter protein ClpS